MAIDSFRYEAYIPTVTNFKYIFDYSVITSLLDDLIKGTLSNFSITSLFSNSSEYFISISYYPVQIAKFVQRTPTYYENLVIGKNQSLKYPHYSFSEAKPYCKIASFTLTRRFNNFLDFAPYTKYKLYVPFFNFIELDGKELYRHTIDIYMSIDFSTGRASVYVFIDDTYLYTTQSTQLGINIPIGTTNAEEQKRNLLLSSFDLAGNIAGFYGGGGNALSGAGILKTFFRDTKGLLLSQVDHMTGLKGGGGYIDNLFIPKDLVLIAEYPKVIQTPDPALKGFKLNEVFNLNSLTGFTIVSDIHFNTYGSDIFTEEINEITSLLREGVIL